MKSMGIFEVKTHLSEILEKREKITITKRGEAIAEIIPISKTKSDSKTPDEIVENIATLRKQIKKRFPKRDPLSTRDMLEEGRR